MHFQESRKCLWILLRIGPFELISYVSCLLLTGIVWLQSWVFYSFRPWYVEPVLLGTIMILTVVAWRLIIAPRSQSSSSIGALVPAASLLTAVLLGVAELPLAVNAVVAVLAGLICYPLLVLSQQRSQQYRTLRIVLGCLILIMNALAVLATNRLFIIDWTK